jgi:hypothetical protein
VNESGTNRHPENFLLLAAIKPSTLLTILLIALSCPSWAALGDNEQSIQRDAAHLRGSLHVVSATPYVLHEIQTPSGYTVREFVSPGGTVFAVSWSGPGGIDLQSLLGIYFEPFQQAAAARQQRQQRGPLQLNTPGLVFEQAGHMRAIHGRAYIPQLLPPNMDPNEIR